MGVVDPGDTVKEEKRPSPIVFLTPHLISSFRCLGTPVERAITFFLFSFNYEKSRGCAFTSSPKPSPTNTHHLLYHPLFSLGTVVLLFTTFLYYSFIYSNYLHDVNLSLPLIFFFLPWDGPPQAALAMVGVRMKSSAQQNYRKIIQTSFVLFFPEILSQSTNRKLICTIRNSLSFLSCFCFVFLIN